MPEEWEILTLRGLTATDERADEFVGTLVIHRAGSKEPVESITVRVRRSVVREVHEALRAEVVERGRDLDRERNELFDEERAVPALQ